ncbi:hypothetical protein BDV11DRAFT_213429 [Aspergillus similis]
MDASYCGDSLLGVCIAIMPIQMVLVAARFYTRHVQHIACTLDDYFIVPALIGSLGHSALYIVLLKVGVLGYHLEYVQQTAPEKLVRLREGLFASQIICYPVIVTFAKLSILLFYTRIFRTSQFQILSYAVGFIVVGTGIGVLFAAIFQCSPVPLAWNVSLRGSCINQQAFFRYVSIPQIFTDSVILVMPLPYVWKLHTRLTNKLALTGVFLLGGLELVASILRMTIFFQEEIMTDSTWVSVSLGIWSVLEGAIIIIAACLPPVWPLFVRFLPEKLVRKTRQTPKDQPQYVTRGNIELKRTSNGFSWLGDQ